MSASIHPLICALDQAQSPAAPATLEAGLSLADRVMRSAEEEGRQMTRDEALFLAGQQLAHASPVAQAPIHIKRVWTNEELEALYPPGISPTLRAFAPLGFMGMVTAMMVGLMQMLVLLDVGPLSTGAIWARAGWLALTGLMFWGSKRLMQSVTEPNAVFRERLKVVDSDSLIRWYHSGCVSHMVVFGVLHERGIRVR